MGFLLTPASLRTYSHKDLALMAKQGGVRGWHSMRKDQLVKALLSIAKEKMAKHRNSKAAAAPIRRAISIKSTAGSNGQKTCLAKKQRVGKLAPRKLPGQRVRKHLAAVKAKLEHAKNLASAKSKNGSGQFKERAVVMVRDPYWLHVYWEVKRQSVERAEMAMKEEWHLARPILRLLEVTDGVTNSASERVASDHEIHGGVNNWYLHVNGSSRNYRVEIGYLAASGRFFSLVRSNIVTTPSPGESDAIDENWTSVAENFDKIYAMSGGYSLEGPSAELQELFEERLRRPMNSHGGTRLGLGMEGIIPPSGDLKLDVDAELIVFGSTRSDAHVSLRGEPLRLRPDGSFTVRMSLPNQRQVIPIIASTADGTEQRTIVLAVERNTKVLEPVMREIAE